jgi:hypothetical protein
MLIVKLMKQEGGQGVREPTGENLNVVWAEFSTLRYAAFVMNVIAWHRQASPSLQLKTQPSSLFFRHFYDRNLQS